MVREYTVKGMTCGGCAANVKANLEKLAQVESADINLTEEKATLTMISDVSDHQLQASIGRYKISPI